MTRLLEILISIAIVAALFLVVGLLLPSSRHLEESVETNREMTIVYDTLNGVRRLTDWHPLALRDPNLDVEISGPTEGVGARLEYDSDERGLGDGSWEIIDTVENRSVTYAVTSPERGKNKEVTFLLEPTGRNNRNVKITQTYDVDYGWNLLGRYAGLYVSSGVGEDMKLGLQRLSNMLAAVPNDDYAELSKDNPDLAPQLARREGQTMLVVTAAVDRTNEAVHNQMKANMKWIQQVMEANDLEPAGPVRIITNEFGSEIYSFDVAQPVRRIPGSEEDGEEEAAAEEESTEEPADEEQAEDAEGAATETETEGELPPEAIQGIEVRGEVRGEKNPVKVVYSQPSLVAVVPFVGHMANLEKVRDALRAWALTRGYETTGRPYEEWLNGFDDGFTVDGHFNVYWTLRGEPTAQVPTARELMAPIWEEINAAEEAEEAEAEGEEGEGENAEG
jgi:hypothetical protein